ncbi:hypothetical protein [Sciscionella marina]|uniref:hypothetical protein n=1 Tax=Sciscionella marina TaxID=508770 RepID=UPI0012F6A14E|nr:hypothetical protein [Sciscionella marina]
MTARRIPLILGLILGGAATVPAALTPSTGLALGCICLARFFVNAASSGGWTLPAWPPVSG